MVSMVWERDSAQGSRRLSLGSLLRATGPGLFSHGSGPLCPPSTRAWVLAAEGQSFSGASAVSLGPHLKPHV